MKYNIYLITRCVYDIKCAQVAAMAFGSIGSESYPSGTILLLAYMHSIYFRCIAKVYCLFYKNKYIHQIFCCAQNAHEHCVAISRSVIRAAYIYTRSDCV